MKRCNILLVLVTILVSGVTARAQQRSPNPQGQRGGATDPSLFETLRLLEAQQGAAGARGGGNRGPVNDDVTNQLRELERYINKSGGTVVVNVTGGAWWTNTSLVSQLGLTEDQKAKIVRSFENNRLSLESSKSQLEKEESQLARLLEAETVDHNAALAQIYRVVNARNEMERVNSVMTLEMRESLNRAQWTQLQNQTVHAFRFSRSEAGAPVPAPAGTTRGGRP